MNNYLIIIIKTIVGYTYLFLIMKLMGKREIGQLNLFDLIILLSIADIMVFGIDNYDTDILYSFIPMLVVALLQKIIALISLKKPKFRKFMDGSESLIIINGKIDFNEMKKQKYNMSDLYSQLRAASVKTVEEVEIAILEGSGKLSVFKNNLQIDSSLPVIISGKIDYQNLKISGYGKEWLEKQINDSNYELKNILGATIIDSKLKIVETVENG